MMTFIGHTQTLAQMKVSVQALMAIIKPLIQPALDGKMKKRSVNIQLKITYLGHNLEKFSVKQDYSKHTVLK